jgi:hypothetical protein
VKINSRIDIWYIGITFAVGLRLTREPFTEIGKAENIGRSRLVDVKPCAAAANSPVMQSSMPMPMPDRVAADSDAW